MPNKNIVEVTDIIVDDVRSVKCAKPGENIKIFLKGIEEDKISTGFMISDIKLQVPCQSKFEAQLAIIDLLPHKSVFSAGYSAIIHIHTAVEECNVTILLDLIDKKTGQVLQKKPKFVKNGSLVRCMLECAQPVCLELFSDIPQLGRFTLRDEGRTIAIGKVTALGPKKKNP
jgi:peptide chain release factor subunit 3